MPRDNDCRWCAMPLEPGRSRGYCDACRASLEPAPKPAWTLALYGVHFADHDGADLAKCLICGDVVDVGGELRAHAADHLADRMELDR